MPRPMLKKNTDTMSTALNEFHIKPVTKNTLQEAQLKQILRRKRSQGLVDSCKKLDAGDTTVARMQAQRIIGELQNELPELTLSDVLLGIVSKCYLGEPYEVHSLDMAGQIIEHYKRGQVMPGGLERARNLAASGSYAYIEVYSGHCCAVADDGSVAIV